MARQLGTDRGAHFQSVVPLTFPLGDEALAGSILPVGKALPMLLVLPDVKHGIGHWPRRSAQGGCGFGVQWQTYRSCNQRETANADARGNSGAALLAQAPRCHGRRHGQGLPPRCFR